MYQGGGRGGGYRTVTIGFPTMTPYVKAILIANVAVWLAQYFVLRAFQVDLTVFLGLSPELVLRGFVWQPLTYMFVHSPVMLTHILFNMLMLWMVGGDLERAWGSRAFLRYYLVCGLGGGVFALILGWTTGNIHTVTVGASGAIYGLFVAFGMLFGDRTILFMMIFPMKARTFALIMFLLAFFSSVAGQQDGIAHIAHLGGAATGFLFLKRAWKVGPFLAGLRWRFRRRRFRVLDRRDDDYPFH